MSLPIDDILEEVYDRLTAELTEDVRYAGAGGAAPDTYVAIQLPKGTRRETKTTRGYTATLVCRCHTEHATGQAEPLGVMQLASSVDDALSGWSPDLGPDHAALYLSTPNYNDNSYAIGDGRRGLDYVLTFDLITQNVS